MIVFDKYWFKENQKTIVRLLNSPIGGFIRRGLWIEDKKNPVVRVTPESVHVLLPDGKVKATIHSNKQYAEALHKNYKPVWEALHWWDMKLANRLVPAWNLGFDTYTSQPDDTSGIDTFIDSAATTTNYASNVEIKFGDSNGSASVWRTLIKFDLSSIPSSNTASSATLSLYISQRDSVNARTCHVYRTLRAWNESQATWNIWSTSNNWTTAGAGSDGNDADLTNSWGSSSFTASETAGTEKQFSLNISYINNFISGAWTNNGWLLRMQTETNDAYLMHSSSSATSSLRPKLVIIHAGSASQPVWFM